MMPMEKMSRKMMLGPPTLIASARVIMMVILMIKRMIMLMKRTSWKMMFGPPALVSLAMLMMILMMLKKRMILMMLMKRMSK